MDHPITEEESYADRRQLFKNIWETAMTIDKNEEKKEGNFINKPKVIKTLRLDEVNRCIVGKKKKQRIKNLRVVCNKLLDFCDRQDADDMFYAQMAANGEQFPIRKKEHRMRKKSKVTKVRKAKKAKSMFTPIEDVLQTGTTSPDRFLKLNKFSENSSTSKIRGTSQSVQDNYRKREKCNMVKQFPGAKMLIRATHKHSNKRLFPINKVNIS